MLTANSNKVYLEMATPADSFLVRSEEMNWNVPPGDMDRKRRNGNLKDTTRRCVFALSLLCAVTSTGVLARLFGSSLESNVGGVPVGMHELTKGHDVNLPRTLQEEPEDYDKDEQDAWTNNPSSFSCGGYPEFDNQKAERSYQIADCIVEISGAEALKHDYTCQSKAAAWISHHDPLKLNLSVTKFVERYAMIVLYYALHGEDWPESDMGEQWLSGENDVCVWHGVKCSESGSVIEIDLAKMKMVGFIPTEISELRNLQKLDLYRNRVQGYIPSSIGNLRRLTYLDLSYNRLEGSIPEEFYDLTSLDKLYLTRNKLEGTISSDIGKLSALTDLRMEENGFTGVIPAAIVRLQKLRFLILRMNNLSGAIPSNLSDFGTIRYIDFSRNNLSGTIPPLPQFRFLYLDHNQLTGQIPSSIGKLGKRVRSLYFNDNMLSGRVPQEFSLLVQLNTLMLQNNTLTGIPGAVCGLAAPTGNGEMAQLEADCRICNCKYLCKLCDGKDKDSDDGGYGGYGGYDGYSGY